MCRRYDKACSVPIFWSESWPNRQSMTNAGQVWPKLGQSSTKFGIIWPDFDQSGRSSGKSWPTVAEIGPELARFAEEWCGISFFMVLRAKRRVLDAGSRATYEATRGLLKLHAREHGGGRERRGAYPLDAPPRECAQASGCGTQAPAVRNTAWCIRPILSGRN